MSEITLVRHGQANTEARDEAEYDRLSPLGHQQSRWLGAHLRTQNQHHTRLYTGTLWRLLLLHRLDLRGGHLLRLQARGRGVKRGTAEGGVWRRGRGEGEEGGGGGGGGLGVGGLHVSSPASVSPAASV